MTVALGPCLTRPALLTSVGFSRMYRFDRKLRILVNDMLERFELSVRTRWAFEVSQASGPLVHEVPAHFTDPVRH